MLNNFKLKFGPSIYFILFFPFCLVTSSRMGNGRGWTPASKFVPSIQNPRRLPGKDFWWLVQYCWRELDISMATTMIFLIVSFTFWDHCNFFCFATNLTNCKIHDWFRKWWHHFNVILRENHYVMICKDHKMTNK